MPKPTPVIPAQVHSKSKSAFSLFELIIAVSIISILAAAVAPTMTRRLAKTRDARRIADMQAVLEAIQLFHADKGRWPVADANAGFSNWDVSHDGGFISELQQTGYLLDRVSDPRSGDSYHYRYKVYPQGSFGCKGYSSFFVLGIREFETDAYESTSTGFFNCSGRNWGDEFDYVTGGGATEK
ncbi:MAG: prepilin-type N-terminal cleavage/methylation domain-containing protein [Planctomycetota bacterium]|jgi:prepilin-type N-terminal cleavage/methylation domain-containing protein